jgi:uncharacterized protein
MSKADAKPTQSLEEILTSIRKALAEEEVQGGADSDSAAPAESVSPSAKQAAQSAPAKGDPLSGQLAVALNGSGGHSSAADDDLSDLLAPVQAKAAPPAEPEPSPAGDKKDPLWFLAPKPAAEIEPAQDDKPSDAAAKAEPPAPQSEITLTRPEVLRSSLPPLFGVDEPVEAKAETVSFVQPVPEKRASFFSTGVPEKAKDEKRESKAPAAEKVVAKPAAIGSELPTPSAGAGVLRPPAAMTPAAEAMASALASPRPAAAKEAPAAGADARALEGVIGQMLEPLIKSWLEANLPRLVEKVVREEVARTGDTKPDPAKN